MPLAPEAIRSYELGPESRQHFLVSSLTAPLKRGNYALDELYHSRLCGLCTGCLSRLDQGPPALRCKLILLPD
jgi:hypothetical protein